MIIIRNFRYRHPISDEIVSDYLADVFEELVNLIGINNNKVSLDGIIIDRVNDVDTTSTLELDRDDFIEFKYISRRAIRS